MGIFDFLNKRKKAINDYSEANAISDNEVLKHIEEGLEQAVKAYSYTGNNALLPEDNKKYSVNENELSFINILQDELEENKIDSSVTSRRMSDGSIKYEYKGMQFLQVNLQKQKTSIQYLYGTSGVKDVECKTDEMQPYIHKAVRYIVNHLK